MIPLYQIFVIAIGFGFIAAAIRRASTPKGKNKFSELMYTDED